MMPRAFFGRYVTVTWVYYGPRDSCWVFWNRLKDACGHGNGFSMCSARVTFPYTALSLDQHDERSTCHMPDMPFYRNAQRGRHEHAKRKCATTHNPQAREQVS